MQGVVYFLMQASYPRLENITDRGLGYLWLGVIFFLYGLGSLIGKVLSKLFNHRKLPEGFGKMLVLEGEWMPLWLLCCICILTPVFVQILCLHFFKNYLPVNLIESTFYVTFIGQISACALLYCIITCGYIKLGDFCPNTQNFLTSFKQAFTYYCEVLPLLVLISIIWYAMLQWLVAHQIPIDLEAQPIVRLLSDNALSVKCLVVTGISVIFLAPVFEEILFRGIIFRFLNARFYTFHALWLSSLLFAILHHHFASFLPLFFLGYWLGRAYSQTGNIQVNVMIHALFNGTNYFLLIGMPHMCKLCC